MLSGLIKYARQFRGSSVATDAAAAGGLAMSILALCLAALSTILMLGSSIALLALMVFGLPAFGWGMVWILAGAIGTMVAFCYALVTSLEIVNDPSPEMIARIVLALTVPLIAWATALNLGTLS